MPEPTVCKFCGGIDNEGTNACAGCVKRYLSCGYCGHTNVELRGPALLVILGTGRWQGMPYDCTQCGNRAINPKVKAIGLPQVNFVKLVAEDGSIIRRRLCPKS